jgi:monofunctional biosynthetic peptidoglycan transglycosylase
MALVIIFKIMLLGYLYISIPKEDILKLPTHFVSIKKNDISKAHYSIVSKRPRGWITFNKIPKHVYGAFIVSEDWSFFYHPGVDVGQIKEALVDSINGKKIRGASTISQQVVKNLFLSPEKTLSRKLKEFAITLYLEKYVSKNKILEIYLNIIEYGEGLYGLAPASQFYFNKSAKRLNAKEAAFLAMLLPNPIKYSQSFREKKLSEYANKTIRNIIKKMKAAGYLNKNKSPLLKRLNFEKAKRIARRFVEPKRKTKFSDGTEYEKNYRYDSDLALKDDPDFDPNAHLEDNSGADTDFSVE